MAQKKRSHIHGKMPKTAKENVTIGKVKQRELDLVELGEKQAFSGFVFNDKTLTTWEDNIIAAASAATISFEQCKAIGLGGFDVVGFPCNIGMS